jgi:hypothetical protein
MGNTGTQDQPAQTAALSGAGSPAGVVNASGAGILYVNTSNGNLYVSTAAGSGNWVLVSGGSSAAAPFIAGHWYPGATLNNADTAGARANGSFLASPVLVGVAHTFVGIGAGINTAGSAGALVRLGLYADNGSGAPGALIVDAGTVAATSATFVSAAISQALAPGLYWAACAIQGAPATTPVLEATNDPPGGSSILGSTTTGAFVTPVVTFLSGTAEAGALPSNFPAGAYLSEGNPVPTFFLEA